MEVLQFGCGGYANGLRRLCKEVAEAMWSLPANWAAEAMQKVCCGRVVGDKVKMW